MSNAPPARPPPRLCACDDAVPANQLRCSPMSENRKRLAITGGADADRTRDLLNAIQALSQTELQPHRWRDFSANRIRSVESTDHPGQCQRHLSLFCHSVQFISEDSTISRLATSI